TLMQQAIQLCADRGCYKVQLSSNLRRTQAHDFYKSLGFQQHGWSFLLTLHPSQLKIPIRLRSGQAFPP
ncbi:MAG: GNAT family N-acetyltransferase, partial [Cyanobacteria bacterium J06635_1]